MKPNISTLVTLTFLSAVLCWGPAMSSPNLDLPFWLPLICVGLSAALSSFLNPQRWRRFLLVAILGSAIGSCLGYSIWRPHDALARSFVPLHIGIETLLAAAVAAPSAFAGSRLPNHGAALGRTAWLALLATTAFGPVMLALTPPLAARRIARNEHAAAQRLVSLRQSIERTSASISDAAQSCNGPLLAKTYTGPPFSDDDWHRITGNYVKQDGYLFMIYCHEKTGYLIHAEPARRGQDGTRGFCTGPSGNTGCDMEWVAQRHVCVPCRQ